MTGQDVDMSIEPDEEQTGSDVGSEPSVLRHSQSWLAHAVYGLILAIATAGELLHHDVPARQSTIWLLGAGLVLLAAHLFSDVLARTAANQSDPGWREVVRIGRHDLAVLPGYVGGAAIMAVAAVGELDSARALWVCVAAGLLAVAVLSYYATVHHRLILRLVMSFGAMVLGALIVTLEQTI